METIAKPPKTGFCERWTFRSLVANPDVETGRSTGAQQNDIAGLILLFDVLIRCFSSLAYSLRLPPVVVAPVGLGTPITDTSTKFLTKQRAR